jgi:hypothetical protein
MRFGKLMAVCGMFTCSLSLYGQNSSTPKPAAAKPTEQSTYFRSWDDGEIKHCETYSGYLNLLICDYDSLDWEGSLINIVGESAGRQTYDDSKAKLDEQAANIKNLYDNGGMPFSDYIEQRKKIVIQLAQAEETLINAQGDAKKSVILNSTASIQDELHAALDYISTHNKKFIVSFSEEAWPKSQTGIKARLWSCTKDKTITCKLLVRQK